MSTDHFTTYGHQLLANGYLIIPIRPGEKSPAISSWQKARISDADVSFYPGHGVGVLCGQGAVPIVGIDIDISHPVIGQAVIEWCRRVMGGSVERVGAAPRVLLVYRAAESGWTKGNSVKFFDPADPEKPSGKPNEQQVEILGLGQQFVAYHVHPDTGRDYEWTDLFGGIAYLPARELPIISEAHIDALMAEVDRLVRSTPGLEIRSTGNALATVGESGGGLNALMSLTPPTGTPISETVELLKYLDNTDMGVDYDTWVRVGMALHHEYAGSPEALTLWKQWGAQSKKDQPGEYDYKWASFARSTRQPTTLRWLLKIGHQAKHDAELQLRRDTLDEIKTIIGQTQDPLKMEDVAQRIQGLMPDDAIIQAEVFSAYRKHLRDIGGPSLTLAEAKKLLLPPKEVRQPTVNARRPLTEFGNAERMLDRYGAGLMYVPEINSWHAWNGTYWRRAEDVEIEHLAKETIRGLVNEIDDHPEPAEFFQFCALSQQAKMVANMVKLAKSDPRVLVPASELDAQPHLIGVQNGVVDLRTLTLLPPDPSYRITRVCGCAYDPTARAPLFEQTVLDVFNGDAALAEFFQRLVGYAACGQPVEDVLVIPFGNGSNGKSTVMGTIRRAFGQYAKAADASSFITDGKNGASAGGAREDLLRLKGARFVYASEPDEGGELREGMVKSMTGGDAMPARGLYSKATVEIVPTWVVFMPTNHKPIIKGTDHGIWRRLLLLPFERNFDADPNVVKDPKREEKLVAEMTGVLAWILRGAALYKRMGLVQPTSVKAARESYRSQMDLLAEWLDECCEMHPSFEVDSGSLWQSWEGFARGRGLLTYIKSSPALGRRLDARFPTKKATGGRRVRLGIRVKDVFRGSP